MIKEVSNKDFEAKVLKRYIELAGLVKDGVMVNKDKEGRARQYVKEEEGMMRRFMVRYDSRKVNGPSGYSKMTDVERYVEKDIADGHFIEAYAVSDQYVDSIIKFCFPEIFFNAIKREDGKITVETALRCAACFGLVEDKVIDMYRDFKSTRDDLIHKSIFNHSKAKQLKNVPKIKKLPFDIIKATEKLFHSRVLPAYTYYLKNKIPVTEGFIPMWLRIWGKQGRDLLKFFDDIEKLKRKSS